MIRWRWLKSKRLKGYAADNEKDARNVKKPAAWKKQRKVMREKQMMNAYQRAW